MVFWVVFILTLSMKYDSNCTLKLPQMALRVHQKPFKLKKVIVCWFCKLLDNNRMFLFLIHGIHILVGIGGMVWYGMVCCAVICQQEYCKQTFDWSHSFQLKDGCSSVSALGVASSSTIPNNQMSASSWATLDSATTFEPWRGRLGYTPRCWCAHKDHQDKNQWLQIDFGNFKKITGVTTQGQWRRWVKTYYILYSLDNSTWRTYQENGANEVYKYDNNEIGN